MSESCHTLSSLFHVDSQQKVPSISDNIYAQVSVSSKGEVGRKRRRRRMRKKKKRREEI
jgi:hypothetical protein